MKKKYVAPISELLLLQIQADVICTSLVDPFDGEAHPFEETTPEFSMEGVKE